MILSVSLLLYIMLPTWMISRGWLIRAGATMVAISLLPWVVWHFTIEGDYGPGAGFVAMLTAIMLLLAVVPLAIGVVRVIIRLSRGRTS